MAADGPLHVVALVSGGKDSFYSVLHCLANGHRVVALANLHPPPKATIASTDAIVGRSSASDGPRAEAGSTTATRIFPGEEVDVGPQSQQHHHSRSEARTDDSGGGGGDEEADLNSFMYQTVGHQVISLYAQATKLPLFRQPILGSAVDHGISYQDPDGAARHHVERDETESLVPLLRAVIKAHPDVNALCTGAILSTYQRTRVESVALRLGLIPLAFLWQYPELPLSSFSSSAATAAINPKAVGSDKQNGDDAQLLRDMEVAGLEARIVKVASAGLGEEFLWDNAASEAGVSRIRRALRRFGGDGGRGAVLGEGGEFETLVVDGPPVLFKGRIVVNESDRRIVREGGGSAWLSIREAKVEMKDADLTSRTDGPNVRIPGLLDLRFQTVLQFLSNEGKLGYNYTDLPQTPSTLSSLSLSGFKVSETSGQDWYFVGNSGGIEDQTAAIVEEIRKQLHELSLSTTAITNSVILLRRMADFPTVNKLYGALFREPNPPARVTISCGDLLLPQDAGITVLLTVQPQMKRDNRRGLHVQSRSYWAPANIGPYSQAIAYPLLADDRGQSNDESSSNSPSGVSIAGQIPLVPASMTLPPVPTDGSSNLPLQITLALQHLWRVGTETHVQWWSSAVAYFPRSSSHSEARHAALLVAAAWKTSHVALLSNVSEDDAEEPDPWDRKYNPLYMTYGDSDNADARPKLPDWEVLKGFDFDGDAESQDGEMAQRPLPFVFSAEVEELPRSAGVEWHAHLGFTNVGSGSVSLYSVGGSSGLRDDPALHHVIVEVSSSDVFVQTVTVYQASEQGASLCSFGDVVVRSARAVKESLTKLLAAHELNTEDIAATVVKPKLTYVDPESFSFPDDRSSLLGNGAIIPCRSLWDSQGSPLSMVSIFETRWSL